MKLLWVFRGPSEASHKGQQPEAMAKNPEPSNQLSWKENHQEVHCGEG